MDANFILVTHDHYDHFSPEDIKKVAGPDAILIVPETMAQQAGEFFVGKIVPFQLYRFIMSLLGDEHIRAEQDGLLRFGEELRGGLCGRIKKMRLPLEYHSETWIYKLIDVWEYDIYRTGLITGGQADGIIRLLQKNLECKKTNGASKSKHGKTKDGGEKEELHMLVSSFFDEAVPESPKETLPKNVMDIKKSEEEVTQINGEAEEIKTSAEEAEGRSDVISLDGADAELFVAEEVLVDTEVPYCMDMGDNLIYRAKVRMEELQSAGTSIDTRNASVLTLFENAVLHDGYLSLEYICCGDAGFLLFWVASLNSFFYSDCGESFSFEIIARLLASGLIRKVTYASFELYALCRERNISVKNVIALQERHYLLSREETDYIRVLRYYRVEFYRPGKDFFCQSPPACEVFKTIPCYNRVYRRQERMIKERGMTDDCSAVLEFTAALGYGYHSLYLPLKEGDALFRMSQPLVFSFMPVLEQALVAGYMLQYRICGGEDASLLRQVVCEMNRKGIFRKRRVQMVSFSKQGLALFAAADEFDYLITLIPSIAHTYRKDRYVILDLTYRYVSEKGHGKDQTLESRDKT